MIMTGMTIKGILPTHVLNDTVAHLALRAGELLMEYASTGDLGVWFAFLELHNVVQMYEDELTYRIVLQSGIDWGQAEKNGGYWNE